MMTSVENGDNHGITIKRALFHLYECRIIKTKWDNSGLSHCEHATWQFV